MNIILASSSTYREKLLRPLIPSLVCIAPRIDESIGAEESAEEYVSRLSLEKAKTVSQRDQQALVIGSDQCAELEGKIITKPGSLDKACDQLCSASGKWVNFHTGLCLFNSATNKYQLACETYRVKFRTLAEEQIRAYLQKDKPYDCAGSFKSEGLGVTLLESMQGNDPNALIGLPLIKLVSMLKNEGVDVLIQF